MFDSFNLTKIKPSLSLRKPCFKDLLSEPDEGSHPVELSLLNIDDK